MIATSSSSSRAIRRSPLLRILSTLALASVVVLASAACRKDDGVTSPDGDDPASLAEDGTDSTAAETDIEIVTSSLVSATTTGGSLSLASTGELGASNLSAQGIGDGAKAIYFPRNCLSVAHDAATRTVTYDFADCTGPNGIFKIKGVVTATYQNAPDKLVLDIVGTDLRINRAIVDWSATAEITTDGVARSMHWKAALSGTTARGKTFSRTNDKVVTWRLGERCFGVSGVSEGKVRDRALRIEVTDFRRCQGACPEAGGGITISNQAKVRIEIVFDGSNQATYTGPKGKTTFPLACQG
jgi:hypothetical protein